MDLADIAAETQERWIEAEIAYQTSTLPAGVVSARECRECGAPISAARRGAVPGCTHCVDCANAIEKRILCRP